MRNHLTFKLKRNISGHQAYINRPAVLNNALLTHPCVFI